MDPFLKRISCLLYYFAYAANVSYSIKTILVVLTTSDIKLVLLKTANYISLFFETFLTNSEIYCMFLLYCYIGFVILYVDFYTTGKSKKFLFPVILLVYTKDHKTFERLNFLIKLEIGFLISYFKSNECQEIFTPRAVGSFLR